MSDMLGISSNAIGAYQRALSTVSNNIANVNTEGYSRQDVVLQDSAPAKTANMYMGTGVILQTIKRQYDAFAESNLRSSTSDLSSQKPMVDYTKRVMDIMGDKSIGLSSALDTFFTAAGALSADPASTVQRTSFMRSADGVASRFGELSNQLDLIATETRQGLDSLATQVNTLTSQLALINQSMTKSPTLEGQPPELLDRRDLTLRQLSDLVRTKVTFTTNGSVSVSLGSTMTQGLVVDGNKARPIGINSQVKDKVELVLDPYGKTESLSSISGGQIGGYQSFISQVLEPAQKNLSALASTFASETNAIQKNGIDGYGQTGQDIFAIDPAATNSAASIHMVISDGMRVATAAQFRVSEGATNVTTTQASVSFNGTTPTTALSNTTLVNNPNSSAGVAFNVDGANVYTSVTTLSAGAKATFYLDQAQPGQQLQVLTRDGRQVLGQSLSETEKYQLLTPANGFSANATFNDTYLNQSGSNAYRGLDMFYGAKATVLYGQNYDQYGAAGPALPTPAVMESARINSADFSIPAGAMQLNGLSLGQFKPDTSTQITVAGLQIPAVAAGATAPDFNFQAVVDDKVIPVTVTAPATMADLVAGLKTQLASQGLTVALINNGKDIQITDTKGRDVSGVSLAATSDDSGGTVTVQSAASKVADWMNGVSQATVIAPNFGSLTSGSFKDFKATIGGVGFDVSISQLFPNNISNLAATLQDQIRAQDKSTNISVVEKNGNLVVTDTAGRAFTDFSLVPNDGSDANGGSVTITKSNVSQTNIRAAAFSEIRVPVSQLQLSKRLILNGKEIEVPKTPNDLVTAINQSGVGLTASISPQGELVIEDQQGGPIHVNSTIDGNALNVQAGTYSPQIRMVQEVRDMVVPATNVDIKKPLQINGINMSEAAYDMPTTTPSASYTVSFGYPAKSVSAATAEDLASKLNSTSDFSVAYKATASQGRLVISAIDANVSDDEIANALTVESGSQALNPQTGLTSMNDLIARINAKNADTGVVAGLDVNGDLKLSVTDPTGTKAISIGPGKDSLGKYPPNALGLEPLDYDVASRLKSLLAAHPEKADIRMSFGTYTEGTPPVTKSGDPSELSKLGFRTGAYVEGGCPDDLLLFVTGKGSANVSVGYSGQPSDTRDSLRSQTLKVTFTAADRYTITDAKTGTQLADRKFDPNVLEPVIEYDGLSMKLTHAPSVGDSYNIDGNFDGLGNNVNMLDMVNLNKKSMADGKTIANNYIDQINSVGNLSQQATITQQALQVVNDQAVAARDKVSGVNLDEEASALIRYQQAYQACAKALQVSGQLFDTIEQIK